jgi:hypothetical protein
MALKQCRQSVDLSRPSRASGSSGTRDEITQGITKTAERIKEGRARPNSRGEGAKSSEERRGSGRTGDEPRGERKYDTEDNGAEECSRF